MKYEVAIVDDHILFTRGVALMVNGFADFEVSIEAPSGLLMQQRMSTLQRLPDIALIDVNMPDMNGIELAEWMTVHYPTVHLIALSYVDTDQKMRAMIRAGCICYLLKDTHPADFEKALKGVAIDGQYHSDSRINFRRLMQGENEWPDITENERKFAQYACSDMPYKSIARLMGISGRTLETLRVTLFKKLGIKTRAGMVVEVVKRGLVEL